jgi:nascent polypeptide-associated complex subunit alpha
VLPGGMDPRKMKALMKQMGIEQEELKGVIDVLIRTRTKEFFFKEPQIVEVRAQGTRTFQVIGKPEERAPGSAPESASAAPQSKSKALEPSGFPEEDVKLVMGQAGCSREEAIDALRRAGGSPAEAILSLI